MHDKLGGTQNIGQGKGRKKIHKRSASADTPNWAEKLSPFVWSFFDTLSPLHFGGCGVDRTRVCQLTNWLSVGRERCSDSWPLAVLKAGSKDSHKTWTLYKYLRYIFRLGFRIMGLLLSPMSASQVSVVCVGLLGGTGSGRLQRHLAEFPDSLKSRNLSSGSRKRHITSQMSWRNFWGGQLSRQNFWGGQLSLFNLCGLLFWDILLRHNFCHDVTLVLQPLPICLWFIDWI